MDRLRDSVVFDDEIGGVKAGILMLVQAPVGVALAALFLDEGIGPVQLLGGLAILAAAVAIQRSAGPAAVAAVDATPATTTLRDSTV